MVQLDFRQTELIKAMRFPLIVLVLYVHSTRPMDIPMYWSLDGENVFRIFSEILSHYVGGLSLCCFFFFSGFLFYHKFEEEQYGQKWIGQKLQRRVKSLLIPHLLWNTLYILLIILISAVCGWTGIALSNDLIGEVYKGPLFWYVTGPVDFPLWYLRNLIVLSLLAPLFYYPVKRYPWLSMIVLLFLYVLTFCGVRFFLLPSITFYGVGVWMSIRKDNLIKICRRIKYPAAVLAIVLLAFMTASYNRGFDNNVFLIFAPFGMITLMNIFDSLLDRRRIRSVLLKLAETTFFIYAAHEIFILGWTKGLFLRVLGDALWARWISYLFVPLVTLGLCIALYYLLKRMTPRTLSVFCGFRSGYQSK